MLMTSTTLETDVFVVLVNFFKTNSELVLLVWKEQ